MRMFGHNGAGHQDSTDDRLAHMQGGGFVQRYRPEIHVAQADDKKLQKQLVFNCL